MGSHLIIGAGAVGSSLALQLAGAGKNVTVLTRSGSGPDHPLIKKVAGDASDLTSLLLAEPQAEVIYNCANPPHYNKWSTEWPPLANTFLKYAEKTGAVLVTCSNLYGYGQAHGPLTEETPLNGTWINSKVRAQMWLDAKSLHDEGRIRATEVRGSDYINPGMQSRMGDRVVKRLIAGKPIQLLGELDQKHSWTDPDDVAKLMSVIGGDKRAWGKPWHVPSNPPKTQREVVMDIAKALGISKVNLSSIPKPILTLLGLFNPVIRELANGNYQFAEPFVIDDSTTRTTFKLEPTPWSETIDKLVSAYK